MWTSRNRLGYQSVTANFLGDSRDDVVQNTVAHRGRIAGILVFSVPCVPCPGFTLFATIARGICDLHINILVPQSVMTEPKFLQGGDAMLRTNCN